MQSTELHKLLEVLSEFFPELQNSDVSQKILSIEREEGKYINATTCFRHILASLPEGLIIDDLDRLRLFCRTLLEITEILLKERSQLYNAHMKVLSGGQVSTEQFMQQVDIEASLMNVYNSLLSLDQDSSALSTKDAIMIHSRRFAVFTILLWILGLLTAVLLFEYLRGHEWDSLGWNRALIY